MTSKSRPGLGLTAKNLLFFVASSLGVLVSCASDRGDDRGDERAEDETSAISTTCGVKPTVGVCEMAVCTSEKIWEVDDRPAGATCNGTGKCDGAGVCVMPAPPPPPSCDHPPPPRYLPGQNGNYPNGADILSCTRPASGVEAWHIDYPSVDRWATSYPIIAFKPGDSVTVSASGCAQTGGSGATWKRYVNPVNDDGHESGMYYGTLSVWGVTGGEQQPLQHWMGSAFQATSAASLALGYVDDGYSDNGYWGHDDGVLGQCASSSKAAVDVVIDHNPREVLTCSQWNTGSFVSPTSGVAELAQIASLLRSQAEVQIGVPITADATASGISHFQIFQDGLFSQNLAYSNSPLNSTELHSDGCVYTAYTPTSAPEWYPIDLAFDADPNKGWLVRPWDPGIGILPPPMTFGSLQANNRDPSRWGATNVPGTCAGCGTSWRTSAPRWITACNGQHLPPSQWTGRNLVGFPNAEPESSKLSHSGAICNWQVKQTPSLSDGCVDFDRAEWSGVYGTNGVFVTAEGVVTNSFLSGGDYSGDHNGMPDGHYVGVHSDPLTHTDVDSCPSLATVSSGEHCADWEMNLLTDANYRHMLAADESQSGDGFGANCKANYGDKYRHGNQADDLKGALGIEGEQWYYPLGFRPEPGDRAVVRGAYIVDCGHADWHTELHPASFMQSSFLQTSDYAPVAGATWNRPPRLTNNWRAITGGNPAVVTKVILAPVHAEGIVTADIWPPARPCAGARLAIAREYETPHPAWKGVTVLSEEMLPADNPNHMRITFQRSAYVLQWGGDGDVQNPDPNLTYFNAYMAWWNTSGVSCPSAGGPGSGACVPNQGAACGSCGGVVQCNGSCSVPTPTNLNASCGSCGGHVQCDSSCSIATPPGTGFPCGSCGGTLQCDGLCSVPTPGNLGASCGSCGGQIQCSGACSVGTPSNLNAPCGSCGGNVLCSGGCSVSTPWNLGAPCGNHGHIICSGVCQVNEP